MAKPKLRIVVDQAAHFLRWELPVLSRHFDLVKAGGADVVLMAFGPDVLERACQEPALRRTAVLFPGFGCNPYHDLDYRARALDVIDTCYDRVFVNPGPLERAYETSPRVVVAPFSLDTSRVTVRKYRESIGSLLHVSADYPQKDWKRSEAVMRATGLPYEVFPPREGPKPVSLSQRFKHRANRYAKRLGVPYQFPLLPGRYASHDATVRKYQQHDGFVHVAADVANPRGVDAKYTACLLEAGLTGAILFWHDTYGLGNSFETVFDLPLDPDTAALRIVEIRGRLDVDRHSRLTRDEIFGVCHPEHAVGIRCARIKELL